MFFKKKCPICGAKNSKERMACIECGAPLASEQPKTQLPHVLTDVSQQTVMPPQETESTPEPARRSQPIVGRFIREAQERRPNTALGKVFFEIKEVFRDKTRDGICAGLRMCGIDARMAVRGQVEEEVAGEGSLGIIHVPDGPIRWINVRKERHGSGQSSTTYYYTEYGVPDSRLGLDSPKAQIQTVRVKSLPIVGKVVDLRWKGGDSDLGIIGRLNSDDQLKQPIMESRDVTITAIRDYRCWIMSTQTRDVPSGELWNCYQAIAQHLLAEWPK